MAQSQVKFLEVHDRDGWRPSSVSSASGETRSSKGASFVSSAELRRAAEQAHRDCVKPLHNDLLMGYCNEIRSDAVFESYGDCQKTPGRQDLRNVTRRMLEAKHATKEALELAAEVERVKMSAALPQGSAPQARPQSRQQCALPHHMKLEAQAQAALPAICSSPSQKAAAHVALELHRRLCVA
jgi:hypothetical protein